MIDITQKNTSLIVKWLRFPMAVLVVYIHFNPQLKSNFVSISDIDWLEWNFDSIYSILAIIINNIATVAVPFFFFTSGYYFFYRTKFNKETYVWKIKKRAKTLLIPYILWNIIAVLCRYSHGLWQNWVLSQPLSEKHSLSLDDICFIPNWISYMWNYYTIPYTNGIDLLGLSSSFTAPVNLPLWFLRDLIVLCLVTPLIYFAVKRGKLCFLIVLWLAYILNVETLAGINIVGLFFFSFGAYLSINTKDVLDTFMKYRLEGIMSFSILFLILLLTNGTKFEIFFNHICCSVGVITVFVLTYKMLDNKKIATVSLKKSDSAFFIYSIHTLPIIVTSPLGLGVSLATSVFENMPGGEFSYI